MEENQGSVTHQNASGDDEKDVVAYSTYRKTVGEVKSLKAKLAEIEAEREQERQSKLAEQGKYKEQAEELLKKLSEKDSQVKKVVNTFGRKVFETEAKSLALGLGARPEAVDDILKVGAWDDVEIDEEFNVNKEQLKLKIEELSKSKPYFFGGNPKAPQSVIPSSNLDVSKTDLSKLSMEELRELAKKIK
jgi:small-conductance mechanosensitive channel